LYYLLKGRTFLAAMEEKLIKGITEMNGVELQVSFFKMLKEKLPPHLSLAQELSQKLNISNDSAYRRIRGEKPLTLDEIAILSTEYKVSIDKFFNVKNGNNTLEFTGKYVPRDDADIESFLEGLVQQLQYFNSFEKKEIFYLNKDIPIFHHFMFPELAAFKCYFWSRYNLNYAKYNKGKFLIDDFINVFNKTGKQISDLYLQIPSTEVWNLDCINTTIRQIDYYRESKIFGSNEDILTIYNRIEKLVDHIENQVEAGVKFAEGKKPEASDVKYKVFINEFILGDNTVIVQLDDIKIVSLNHNVVNYVMTSDEKFVEYTFDTLQTILKKSTLISEVGEKERHLFFDGLRERVYAKKKLAV
jgi:hypothetical protein